MKKMLFAAVAALATVAMVAGASAQVIRGSHTHFEAHGSGGYYQGPPMVFNGIMGGGGYGGGYGGRGFGLDFTVFGIRQVFRSGIGERRAFPVPANYWEYRGVRQRRVFDCGIHLSLRRLEDNANVARHIQDQIAGCEPGYRHIVMLLMP